MNYFSNNTNNRSGATLILTLGILTVISILAATFLITARLQKQTAVTTRNRHAADKALPIALSIAMRQIEESFSYPNYTDETMQFTGEAAKYHRLSPINRWFSDKYSRTNNINENITFQHGFVMTSPTVENYPSVNLLTPEALSHIPSVLTNGLPLDASNPKPLRSGWIPTNILLDLFPGIALDYRLQSKPSRIAFAVFDCSGTIDANIFPQSPSHKKKQKKYYAQSDINQVLKEGKSDIRSFLESNSVDIAKLKDKEPFFHTSYDPNPNTFRHKTLTDVLGNERFLTHTPFDLAELHMPDANNFSLIMDLFNAFLGNRPYNKFNLNSITNAFINNPKDWYNTTSLINEWFRPTEYISEICRQKDKGDQNYVFDSGNHLAWSIANFIDPDRIPTASVFTGNILPTRSNYAVEDVPLISKISLFNIDDGTGNNNYIGPPDKLQNHKYYGINDQSLSNHYAVAVELWYPFAPNSPFENCPGDPNRPLPACYVGIYTNEADVITTTNRPLSSRELERFFGTNIVMKVLFETWAREYEKEVGWEYLDGNPLWQEIRNVGDYWFTPAMINSPLWQGATAEGEKWFTVATTNSPLYKTFYPETYDVIATNTVGSVSTNSYTYITQTNKWFNFINSSATNEFVYGQYIDDQDYMVMYWEDSVTGTITNSLLGGIINEYSDFIELNYTNNIAKSIIYGNTPDESYIVSENPTNGIISTNLIAAIQLSPDTDPPQFTTHTNIFNQYSVAQVTPLDMPPEFEQALNEIFLMLPTNSISAIHDFMLLTTDDIVKLKRWDELFNYFSSAMGIQKTIIPQIVEPSLGNMTEENKFWLESIDPNTTIMTDPDIVNGYFWTVYPKQTASFMEITERAIPGETSDSEKKEVVTNCYALGAYMPGNSNPNTIWIRPVTTVKGEDVMVVLENDSDQRPVNDRIVDEAVMLSKGNKEPDTVQGWRSVTNIFVADPRDNAYANKWIEFDTPWETENLKPDIHDGVKELPFIHFNAPLQTIGDLGHIYTEYRRLKKDDSVLTGGGVATTPINSYKEHWIPPLEEPADTLEFSTLSGASLLDFFTIKPNKPQRGLVQANTTLEPTLDILFSDVMIGWTNNWSGGNDTWQKLEPKRHNWTTLWQEALTNDLYNTGWRSFADMLPDLATNEMHKTDSNISGIENPIEKHNYTEDVLRGIIDKVSFRQNVYVIILAAQTIAPGSSIKNPNVLAEQRVAVTVIRDAYSGNWTISDWRKLH